MARRVFFSFHFDRDNWRIGVVRNAWLTKGDAPPFYDAAAWEQVKKARGIQRWIDDQLSGTSVTVVLIGAQTSTRPWVKYEISQSIEQGKGLLGVYIHNIRDRYGSTDARGVNPLPGDYSTYDWVNDRGFDNIGIWVEQAARKAGR